MKNLQSNDNNNGAQSMSDVVAQCLGEIEWIVEDKEAVCDCPGQHLHTSPTRRKHCVVFVDSPPTIHCVHQSCAEMVKAANQKLRQEMAKAGHGAMLETAISPTKVSIHDERNKLVKRAYDSCDTILKQFSWPYAQILAASPLNVGTLSPPEQTKRVIESFAPDDIIWTGDLHDSGRPEHAGHFKTREEWLREHHVAGPFICPSVFKAGVFSRSNDAVTHRRWLVLESDSLDRDQVGAIFKWLDSSLQLRLKAVVDSAGRSLHGWFVPPASDSDELRDLRLILPILGCDPKTFGMSQPVRLAGALRDGQVQKLIYFDPEVESV